MVTGLHGIKRGLGKCCGRRGPSPGISHQGRMESACSEDGYASPGALLGGGDQQNGWVEEEPDLVTYWPDSGRPRNVDFTSNIAPFQVLFQFFIE